MRVISYEIAGCGPRPGMLVEEGWVLDLNRAVVTGGMRRGGQDLDLAGLIALHDKETPCLSILNETMLGSRYDEALVPRASTTLRAPIGKPRKNIFCVGRNYLDHVAEGDRVRGVSTDLPAYPQFFTKPPTAVIGPDERVEVDARISGRLDYEVELAIVIGRGGKNIPESEALDHIFGYTIINDVSARDLQQRHGQWFKGKALDSTCPVGPWIVTADAVGDPQNLSISLQINGEERQRASTSQMIFSIARIVSELSQGLTLEPGDVIATGTPSGVGFAMEPPRYLEDGDVMTCRIEGVGELSNRVRIS
ncbi:MULTISPECIES: fumarylacetoacetate hydrolase family protein [Sphingobium]|jgi:2-keto-4-pentenoate hydratase/2-oxohepta-3-ene-1,7-dioic acid hydratase in catechol pathway|uniref:fumarylacetoacetate hydrolase family protein n=1 Tax=Sphingobium TaxID=165695 RepID=UPI000C4B7A1F|nr:MULTISPECIES: fumarylacetoacetate hydrolase family protein [Sphingobium]MBS90176.1 hydrolase [Sphingobium sp.]QWT16193.1 fumarylacetoacetate hydrolase family protein [Sphingobium xenophagum]